MTLPKVQLFDSPSGQWRLETGVGRLRSFAPNGPRYVEVTIDAPPLATRVTGWADRDAEPFTTLFANGLGHAAIDLHDVDVEYRVEVRRRQGVDKSIPLEDLEPHQKRRRMVHLVATSADPEPAPVETVTIDATPAGLDRLEAAAPDVERVWDFSGFDFSDNPAMPQEPGLAWDKYRGPLRLHAANRAANHATSPSTVAFDDQVVATIRSWLAGIGLDADERTVFTIIASLRLLESGLIMRGRLCMATAHEIELLISVMAMLAPEWVIVDA